MEISSMESKETEDALSLESVKLKFQEWRSRRKLGEPIPEELWSLAVALTDCYSISKVSRSLKLAWHYLKRRVLKRQKGNGCGVGMGNALFKEPASFLELKLDDNGFPPVLSGGAGCLLEIHKMDGSHLKLTFPMSASDTISLNMTQICESFVKG